MMGDRSSSNAITTPHTGTSVRIWIVLVFLLAAPLALRAASPQFEDSPIFVSGHDGINTYRIPSIIATSNGTILVFCEGRRDSYVDGTATNLVLKRSLGNSVASIPAHGSKTADAPAWGEKIIWQPMQVLLATKAGEAYMNPVPIIDKRDGTIFLLVNYYPQPYQDVPAHTWMMKSHDEGATWSPPTDISSGTGLKELGPGIGIQMQNGRLVAATYDGVIFSDDHGKTWKSGGKVVGHYTETQVVELVNGSLMLNIRHGGHRVVALSKDGGETWGKPWTDPALIEPENWEGCQASLIRYTRKRDGSSKDRLLFADPASPKDRLDMTVRVSYDEGQTWPVSRLIEKGRGGYSSLAVLPDRTIAMVYEGGTTSNGVENNFGKISFARFNLEWLTNGQDQLKDGHDGRQDRAARSGARESVPTSGAKTE
jgi:sialidase-1